MLAAVTAKGWGYKKVLFSLFSLSMFLNVLQWKYIAIAL